jgi:sugar phosphate isomerase/epimerase
MTQANFTSRPTRRAFLGQIAGTGAALTLGSGILSAKPKWSKQIGLELYTVRDRLNKDFEGTIAEVARIGYTEVEPVGYGGLDPKAFRALLDRYKLTAPSTHTSAQEGPNLEKELAEHQLMGFQYTQISAPRQSSIARPTHTLEWAKNAAATLNRQGNAAKKFGMKVLYHNHAHEFDKLEGSELSYYDVLLTETDGEVVTMQLDIGWAIIAGQDVPAMFAKHPGRFELWHVKDVKGLKQIDTSAPPSKRRGLFMPIGQGEIDYAAIFKHARKAGLRYYVIEQDNAGDKGADSMAAAKAGFEGLKKALG